MAHISLDEKNPTSFFVRLVYWYQKKQYGHIPEPILAWGNSPSIFKRFLSLWNNFNRKQSPLSPRLRSLVSIIVSQENACAFCVDLHSYRFLKTEEDQKKIEALPNFSTSELFTPAEKLAFEYAKLVTQTPVQVSSTLMDKLKEHYSEKALVELTALISFQNMSSKFNTALGTSAFGFCQLTK